MQLPVNVPRLTQGWNNFNPKFYPRSMQFRHKGIDLVSSIGDKNNRVVRNGIVTESRFNGAWGNVVIVYHGDGLETWYAHNERLFARVKDQVLQGQSVGIMGKTGNATGVHTHFAAKRNGVWIDPTPFMVNDFSYDNNQTYMFSFEESIHVGHYLMLGRDCNTVEFNRFNSMPKNRASIDFMMKDLARNTTDSNTPTYRNHVLNALAYFIRGSDLSDQEINGLQVATAYMGKVATGIMLAEDRKRKAADPEYTPKLLDK